MGSRADAPAQRGACHHQVQAAEEDDCNHKCQTGELAHDDAARQGPTVVAERVDVWRQGARIGAEALEHRIVEHAGEAKRAEQRQQRA
jgi:hypothetical protein